MLNNILWNYIIIVISIIVIITIIIMIITTIIITNCYVSLGYNDNFRLN